MKNQQAVREKLASEIEDLEQGIECVAREMGCSQQNLRKILNPADGRLSKLETFERVKEAIKACRLKQAQRETALLT